MGYGRGTQCTASDPFNVSVLTDVTMPMPVDSYLLWEDREPGIDDSHMAAGGAALENGGRKSLHFPATRSLRVRELGEGENNRGAEKTPCFGATALETHIIDFSLIILHFREGRIAAYTLITAQAIPCRSVSTIFMLIEFIWSRLGSVANMHRA